MGYTTDFNGKFKFNKQLDEEIYNLLVGLATTRRMKRQGLDPKYGYQGEFYFNKNDFSNAGQTEDTSIVDYNEPPDTQPSLWLQWIPTNDSMFLEWDGGEKFYSYIEWLEYLINKILAPHGYSLTGEVYWYGEDRDDNGIIEIVDNKISIHEGKNTYEQN